MRKLKQRLLALALVMTLILSMGQGYVSANAKAADAKAAEYEYTKLDQTPMKESATASSAANHADWGDGAAALAFDGDVTSCWHSDYDDSSVQLPQWIEWELGGTYNVGRISYSRKQGGVNGTWKTISVTAYKEDGTSQKVYEGTIEEPAQGASIDINFTPVEAAKLRVEITDSYNEETRKHAAAGEINVWKATLKEPEITEPLIITPSTLTVAEGEEFTLNYELTPEAQEAGWTACWDSAGTNSSVVRFDTETGKGVALGEGEITIQAKAIKGNTSVFRGCKITVTKVETECVIAINGTDYTGTGLEDVIAKAGLNSAGNPETDIESIEFKSGVIREEDFSYISNHAKWFDYELKTFKVSDDVEVRGLAGNAVPTGAFKLAGSSIPNLTTVYLGKNIKGLEVNAFAYCRDLTSFEAPGVEVIRRNALPSMKAEELNFPALRILEEDAFEKRVNSSVKKFRLPALEELDNDAFANFKALEELELGAVPPTVSIPSRDLEFADGVIEKLKFTFPEGAEDDYKADDGYRPEADSWYGIPMPTPAAGAVVAKVNGGEAAAGASLADVIVKSGVDAKAVTSLEFTSGNVTPEDLAYLREELTRIETLKLNLSETLTFDSGSATLPEAAFENVDSLENVELAGFTILAEDSLRASGITNVKIPDVITIRESAFHSTRIESIELPKVETIEGMAFYNCERLTEVDMPKVVTIGQKAFYHTDEFENIHLPASIETLTDVGFGVAGSGKKTLKVVIDRATPPTNVSGSVFSNAAAGSSITVPAGSLPNYLPELDLTKHFDNVGQTKYESLRVIDPEYHFLTFRGVNSYDVKYAYVKNGESITEERIPSFKNGDKILSGWNTEKDGNESGISVDAETVPTEDLELYAQWSEPTYTVTFKVQDRKYGTLMQDGKPVEKIVKTVEGKKDVAFPELSPVQNCELEKWIDEEGKEYNADSVTLMKDREFTAVFAPKSELQILYKIVDENGEVLKKEDGSDIGGDFTAELNTECRIDLASAAEALEAIGYEMEQTEHEFLYSDLNTYTLDGELVVLEDIKENYLTFTAKKKEQPIVKHSVIFNVDGRTTEVQVISGEKIGDGLPSDPVKEGFDFVGWNTQKNGEGTKVNSETVVTGDLTVYAVFREKEVPKDTTAPTKPEGLQVTDTKKDSVTISWKASADNVGVKEYKIYVDGKFAGTIDAKSGEKELKALIKKLTPNTRYTIGVSAVDAAGNESEIATVSVTTAAATATVPNRDSSAGAAKTGDTAPILMLFVILAAAGAAVVFVSRKKFTK